jgi:hypothetical protein
MSVIHEPLVFKVNPKSLRFAIFFILMMFSPVSS